MIGRRGQGQCIFAAEVCEGALLSELYRLALDENGDGRVDGLLRVHFVGGKFICAEFGGGQVELKYLGKGCNCSACCCRLGRWLLRERRSSAYAIACAVEKTTMKLLPLQSNC